VRDYNGGSFPRQFTRRAGCKVSLIDLGYRLYSIWQFFDSAGPPRATNINPPAPKPVSGRNAPFRLRRAGWRTIEVAAAQNIVSVTIALVTLA